MHESERSGREKERSNERNNGHRPRSAAVVNVVIIEPAVNAVRRNQSGNRNATVETIWLLRIDYTHSKVPVEICETLLCWAMQSLCDIDTCSEVTGHARNLHCNYLQTFNKSHSYLTSSTLAFGSPDLSIHQMDNALAVLEA